ncbi:hypothetical protein BH10PSE12_BH10PSE12_24160 [soil metagenome]
MGTHLEWCVMNEFVSRSEILPVDRISRTAVVLPGVQAATPASADTDAAVATPTAPTIVASPEGLDLAAGAEDQLASAAEYARVHASIADILANIRSVGAPATSQAPDPEEALLSLLPAPVIIIPLPPASKDMVERAEMMAKDMADQAALTRSAQAHVKPGTVDQILASAA